MVEARLFLKVGMVAAVVIGASGPLAASDQLAGPRVVLGAPATAGEQFFDRKFNFSPPELTERQRLIDDRFNYVQERDRMTVQDAK
jgi:hypothetical protein